MRPVAGAVISTLVLACCIACSTNINNCPATGSSVTNCVNGSEAGAPPSSADSGPPSDQGSPASQPDTPGSATSAPTQSSAPASQHLGDLTPVAGSGSLFNGAPEVNGQVYPNSIYLALNPGPASVEYNLGRQWRKLDVTVGLSDDSTANQNVQFQLRADGRVIYTRTFALGQSQHVKIDVSGVLRFELDATLVSNYAGEVNAVWGSAELLN